MGRSLLHVHEIGISNVHFESSLNKFDRLLMWDLGDQRFFRSLVHMVSFLCVLPF